MDLDKLLIRSLINGASVSEAQEQGLLSEMFHGKNRDAFDFVVEFTGKHGKTPDITTLEAHTGESFTDIPVEPAGYYIERIRRRWLGLQVVGPGLDEAIKLLNERKPEEAIAQLKEIISRASVTTGTSANTGLADLRLNTKERWEEYERVRALDGKVDGIPFPWPELNHASMGIHPGELWIIVARLKIGKTWSEVVMAEHFFKMGYKVLFATMEMPLPKIAKRMDAMYSRLPYMSFKSGRLSTEEETRYIESLGAWSAGDVPFYVCGKGRIKSSADLELVVEELKPDIVVLDGAYLMRSSFKGQGGKKWENVAGIMDDLQDLGQRKLVPIIATTQFNRKVKRDKILAGPEDIGFAYETAQNADGLIALFQTEQMRSQKEMLLRLLEHREGEPVNLLINWDFSEMDFSQKSVVKGDELTEDSESLETVSY
jgi:replicative DNA helicase